jgi:hypothetical protein
VAFWDASAIVPLCCSQTATSRGRKVLRELQRMVVWWGTPVEARSAFARLADVHVVQVDERVAPDGDPDRNLNPSARKPARELSVTARAGPCHAGRIG